MDLLLESTVLGTCTKLIFHNKIIKYVIGVFVYQKVIDHYDLLIII